MSQGPEPTSQVGRRAGGRAARRAKRAAGPAEGRAPIHPGIEGGAFRPLKDSDIKRIHGAALELLERVGMGEPIPLLTELALAKGCRLTDEGRLCFPRALVEDIVAGAAQSFVLHGRNPRHDLEIGGTRVHFGTGGAAVKVLDPGTGRYRPSTLVDLYDFARLVDRLDNVHWFTRCIVATDLPDMFELDMNTLYACIAGTEKHIGTNFYLAKHVAAAIEMFDLVLGGEGRFRKRPFCKVHSSPVVSPLRYGADNAEVAVACARAGMPVNSIIAAQSGATAPAALAGMLAQTVAETLAGLILVNLVVPGHPVIFSNWPFVSDLRTGAFTGGGGEIALLNAASAQITNFYGLPSGVAAGMADSKLPDDQAGYEKALTNALAGLAGANLVYESSGMLASLLGCSFESFVIDDEMLGLVQRAMRPIEVSDETLSLQAIEDAVTGPGHFLGHAQTLELMESEYLYPALGDRHTPDEWEEQGAKDIRERARERLGEILAAHYPAYIAPSLDARLRERFPIHLPAEAMGAASGRW
jgi:trimethylamine--corrinoid protein Co-methyltransferase